MFRVENVVGKLIEIHVKSLANMEEMRQFAAQVVDIVGRTPGRPITIVDLRTPSIFAPDVAEALEDMLKRVNPKIERTGVLLAREHAVFSLQLERIVREAWNPSRRTFRDPEQLKTWLHDALTAAELARLEKFLAGAG